MSDRYDKNKINKINDILKQEFESCLNICILYDKNNRSYSVYIKDFFSKTGKPHLDIKGFDNKMFAMKDGIKRNPYAHWQCSNHTDTRKCTDSCRDVDNKPHHL